MTEQSKVAGLTDAKLIQLLRIVWPVAGAALRMPNPLMLDQWQEMRTACDKVDAILAATPTDQKVEAPAARELTASGREMALMQQLLDEVDDCPGLTMAQDKWLSDKIREGFASYFAILAATKERQ